MRKRTSRRLKVSQKKLYKKVFILFILSLFSVVFIVYIGLPILAKIIVGISSLTVQNTTSQETESNILLPPVINPVPEATNSSEIVLTGFSFSKADIEIFKDEVKVKETKADKDGLFQENITLDKGENSITARVVEKDKKSNFSNELKVELITSSPKLEISKPEDGDTFSKDNRKITIEGSTDPEASITINDRVVIVNPNGDFDFSTTLEKGENVFIITAVDKAGNQKTAELKVHYRE